MSIVMMVRNNDKDSSINQVNMKDAMIMTNNKGKSNKCNQCEYASSQAGDLSRHLKMHSGEKSNKYN